MATAALLVFSYLFGSIPFAYSAGRLIKGIDIRKVGDRNAGAANVYRHISHLAGVLVLLADAVKGAVPILLARAVSASLPVMLLCGVAAVLGHNWPVFSGFKGGRGESTAIGVFLALMPLPMTILMGVCLVPFLITRNTVLAGAILFAPLWLVAWLLDEPATLVLYSIALPVLVGVTHFLTTRHLEGESKREAPFMR